jgi:mycothiol synthase
MERLNLDGLPPLQVPEPYQIRSYQPNDEVLWTRLVGVAMNSSWTVEACRERIISAPGFDPDGLFFAVLGDEVVGTACAFHEEKNPPERGTVHMVCVHPDHRGFGLGYWLSLSVLHRFRERGLRSVQLLTDDMRLPAIHIYLKLGFQPNFDHESYPKRWEAVMKTLRGSSNSG